MFSRPHPPRFNHPYSYLMKSIRYKDMRNVTALFSSKFLGRRSYLAPEGTGNSMRRPTSGCLRVLAGDSESLQTQANMTTTVWLNRRRPQTPWWRLWLWNEYRVRAQAALKFIVLAKDLLPTGEVLEPSCIFLCSQLQGAKAMCV